MVNLQSTPEEDPPLTREELNIFLNSEIAMNILYINDVLPGGEGLEYVQQKTQEYCELIKQGYRGLVLRVI